MKKIDAKRIWFITDTHLGVRNSSEDWINIHRNYFYEWFIPLVKKNYREGDILMHLGDVYDSRQSLNLKVLNLGIEIFEDLSEIFKNGIFIICGNHDIFGRNTNEINSLKSLKWIPKVKIFEEPETIQFGPKKVFLMPWRKDHDAERETLMTVKEPHDYMFCHTDLKGLMFNKFVRIDAGLDYADMDKFERVYSGHIHYSQTFGKMRMLGSPFQLTRSDTDNAKGITVLDLETGDEEYYENNYSPKFVRITFDKVLNSTPNELNPIFKNNFIDILVDPELAVKAPLGLLTEYVIPPLKISFTPITNPGEELVDEGFHDLEGKSFSILDLTKLYLDKCNYEDDKKSKIYKAIEKLLHKVSVQVKEDEDQED
jgi:calcineurin-like phosphoesterase family protein